MQFKLLKHYYAIIILTDHVPFVKHSFITRLHIKNYAKGINVKHQNFRWNSASETTHTHARMHVHTHTHTHIYTLKIITRIFCE